MSFDRDDFEYVPLSWLTTPRGGLCTVYLDCWWLVEPERDAAMFYRSGRRDSVSAQTWGIVVSPQCNHSEAVQRQLVRRTPWAEVRLVPVAFVPTVFFDQPPGIDYRIMIKDCL